MRDFDDRSVRDGECQNEQKLFHADDWWDYTQGLYNPDVYENSDQYDERDYVNNYQSVRDYFVDDDFDMWYSKNFPTGCDIEDDMGRKILPNQVDAYEQTRNMR